MGLHDELLSRIDERTKNIEARQLEEISERKKLNERVSSLEGWRNFLGGSWAVMALLVSGALYLAKNAIAAIGTNHGR